MINQNESINEIWDRIEIWATNNFPKLIKTLANGAPEFQTNNLNQFLKYPLPLDLQTSLMRHNGQNSHPAIFWHMDVYKLMSIEEIVEELEYRIKHSDTKKELDTIPIAKAGTGDKIWLEFDTNGEKSIRLRSHDSPNVPELYCSYKDWLKGLADDLEAGRYHVDEYGSLNRKFPNKKEREKLIIDAIDKVAKMEGNVELVVNHLSKAINQPEWIVSHYISTYRLKSDLEDRKYEINKNK